MTAVHNIYAEILNISKLQFSIIEQTFFLDMDAYEIGIGGVLSKTDGVKAYFLKNFTQHNQNTVQLKKNTLKYSVAFKNGLNGL